MLSRHWSSTPALLAAVIGLCVTGVCIAENNAQPAKPVKKARPPFDPKITIGKETTWATEPVGPNGFIDYLSVVNRHYSEGVTPDNNSVVELYLATGPAPDNSLQPDEFFRLLGVQVPPKEGNYFEDPAKWWLRVGKPMPAGGNQGIHDMAAATQSAPWTAKDYPEIADWLQSIEEPLKHVVSASERTEYYSPLVFRGPEGRLIEVLLPGVQTSRALIRALSSRAMLHLGNGDRSRAWADIIAIHRLGRLVGRGPTLIEGLVGIAIESVAIEAELRFISETHPGAKFVSHYVKQLQELPPRSRMADKINLCERLMFLDCCTQVARGNMKLNELTGNGSDTDWASRTVELMAIQALDWNRVLKTGNQWYDRIVAGAKLATYRERSAAMRKLEEELKQLRSQTQGFSALSIFADKASMTRFGANTLISLLLPAVTQCVRAEGRIDQRFQDLTLAFALETFRDEQKAYPDDLAKLAPKYVATVPVDLFIEQPLHYQKTDDGYRLYSVGENEQDDMGRSFDDTPRGDDLIVQMPKPLPKK